MRNSIEGVIKQEILQKALKNEEAHRRNQNEFRLSGVAYMFQDFLRRALKSEEFYTFTVAWPAENKFNSKKSLHNQ